MGIEEFLCLEDVVLVWECVCVWGGGGGGVGAASTK